MGTEPDIGNLGSGSEWKIRRDEHWQQMLKDKWDERMTYIAVKDVTKDGYDT